MQIQMWLYLVEKKKFLKWHCFPKFAATPAVNKLIQNGQYLGQMD